MLVVTIYITEMHRDIASVKKRAKKIDSSANHTAHWPRAMMRVVNGERVLRA